MMLTLATRQSKSWSQEQRDGLLREFEGHRENLMREREELGEGLKLRGS